METIEATVPAGVSHSDPDIEFYVLNGELFFTQFGSSHPFSVLNVDAAAVLREELDNNPRILETIELLGISDPMEQLVQFVKCRFGNFDKKADLTATGVVHDEYVNCTARGTCNYEGILCRHVHEAPNGKLTPREIEIVKLIDLDLPDKIIADRLGISVNTMAVHRTNIARKIGCHTKVGITSYAHAENLI